MALGVVAAFGLAPDTMLPDVPTHFIARELALPALTPLAPVDGYWREERIQRGDTLGGIFARLSVTDPAALGFVRADTRARPLYQLKPGKSLRVLTDDDGHLIALSYPTADGALLAVDRVGDHFVAHSVALPAAVHVDLRAGEVRSSLFAAADAVGLPDAITIQIAEIFSGEIDFHHDLRRGDRFTVVYETRELDAHSFGTGRVLAAEFVNKGLVHRAFLWRAVDGSEGYYAEDGKSLRRAFLRSPVAFSRVTSGFSLARFHPFLHTWRAHKGVDFAAPAGTPVHAAGDGQVVLAGTQNGYGNVVILRHAGAYSTVYGHLSRFAAGVRKGAQVAQGDVIGYVGQTGWATGPHLHYEFRVNDVERNPLTIALPNAQPIPASDRAAYLERSAPLAAQLALGRNTMLAGAD
jgi:murein DD-endopeptidase MepM/ murein hydrolase activator NlpD